MSWLKKGLIYCPDNRFGWDKSHAQIPTAVLLNNNTILRIYFAARNENNQSQISFIDVRPDKPDEIIYRHPRPILIPGRNGTFDDCGVMPSWVVANGVEILLYYIGWNVRNTVPYYNSVGLATSIDGVDFKKISEGPLWDRDYREPYFSASSCVLYHEGKWKNWYLSCTEYRLIDGKYEPRYHLKYAESANGIDWIRNGIVAIDYKSEREAGIVKASVVIDKDCFRMWFSYRNFENYRTDRINSYKIGYAESDNGIEWSRKDHLAGIDLSETGWDSEMIAYPHVIDSGLSRYLFYNGNGFGKTGFGYATFSKNINC